MGRRTGRQMARPAERRREDEVVSNGRIHTVWTVWTVWTQYRQYGQYGHSTDSMDICVCIFASGCSSATGAFKSQARRRLTSGQRERATYPVRRLLVRGRHVGPLEAVRTVAHLRVRAQAGARGQPLICMRACGCVCAHGPALTRDPHRDLHAVPTSCASERIRETIEYERIRVTGREKRSATRATSEISVKAPPLDEERERERKKGDDVGLREVIMRGCFSDVRHNRSAASHETMARIEHSGATKAKHGANSREQGPRAESEAWGANAAPLQASVGSVHMYPEQSHGHRYL
eukprot:366208-Chlamydomonas_euryale.AAC.2